MYKSKHCLSPELLKYIFIERLYQGHALRLCSDFVLPKMNTVHYGHDSLRYFGSQVWNMIPAHIKYIENLEKFKAGFVKHMYLGLDI